MSDPRATARTAARSVLSVVAFLALVTPLPADVVQHELLMFDEPVVAAAAKHEQYVEDAPSSVSIVTADDIKKYGYRTLAEILRSVRGLYVTYDRNYSFLGVRGFNRPGDSNSRILLLVDGHRVTENIYDSNYLGTDFIVDVDMINRVEVIRGPGSALYGSNAFFAVIDVITKRRREMQNVETSFDAASFDTYKGRISGGHSFANGVDVVVSGTILDSAGDRRLHFDEFDAPETNNGVAEGIDGERAYDALATISYRDVTAQGAYNWRKKDVPTASFETVFNNPHEWTTDSLGYVDLKYDHRFANDIETVARVNFSRYKYDGSYPYDISEPGEPPLVAINKDDVLGQWLGTELQAARTIWSVHRLTLGTEYRWNIDQDIQNFDVDPHLVYSDVNRDSWNWGIFAQGESELLSNLHLTTGLRYDLYETFGGTWNPRAALIYHPWAASTFKALYGRAFRAPNVWEAFNTDPVSKPNSALDPETINTYELVYEQRFLGAFSFSTSAYYNQIQNLISQESDPADDLLINVNADDVDARGLEFELVGQHPSGLRGQMSYAIQKAELADSGKELDNSPRHLAKFHLVVPVYRDNVFAAAALQYSSRVRTLAHEWTDAYYPVSCTLVAQNFFKGLELSASVYNLFDQHYAYPGATQHVQDIIYQDGTTFRVKLTYRF